MRVRTAVLALATAAIVALSGSAFAQTKKGNGSGMHGVGAGSDPATTGAPAAPDAGGTMAPADGAAAAPMDNTMAGSGKTMKTKHHSKAHHKAM